MRTTMKIDQIKQLALRVFATFAYNAMAVIGSASLIGGILSGSRRCLPVLPPPPRSFRTLLAPTLMTAF